MSDYYYLLRFDLSAPEDRQSNSELVCDGDEYRFGEIPLWLDRDDTSCPEREERRRLLSMITIDIKDKGLVRQQGCKKALPFIQELATKSAMSHPSINLFSRACHISIIIVWIGIPQGDCETRRKCRPLWIEIGIRKRLDPRI
jgi:hypothetical protein